MLDKWLSCLIFTGYPDKSCAVAHTKQIARISELNGKAADAALSYDQISPKPVTEYP
jgi:hypothetical protein